jgi:hypothetical protein
MRASTHRAFPGDVVIRLADANAVSVRVCISPIATLLATVFEALLDQPRGAPPQWYRHVRATAGAHAADLEPVYRTPARTFPEFVAPNPIAARSSIEQELSAMRATPPERIRREVEQQFGPRPPEAYRRFVSAPRQAIEELAGRLEAVWNAALAPLSDTIESILERELLSLGAALASEGTPSLLARLHPRIGFDGTSLRWTSRAEGREVTLAEGRLVVVPIVAGPDALMSTNRPEAGSIIAYAAPGSAALWEAADTRTGAALATLVGETRSHTMLAVSRHITSRHSSASASCRARASGAGSTTGSPPAGGRCATHSALPPRTTTIADDPISIGSIGPSADAP